MGRWRYSKPCPQGCGRRCDVKAAMCIYCRDPKRAHTLAIRGGLLKEATEPPPPSKPRGEYRKSWKDKPIPNTVSPVVWNREASCHACGEPITTPRCPRCGTQFPMRVA